MDYEKQKYRGTCIFWIIIYLLFAVCICNVALTIYLISVFEIGKGMRNIEVVDDKIMNFYGSVDLGVITKDDGLLQGFAEPFGIVNENEPLHINLVSRIHTVHNKFRQDAEGIHINGIANFEIKNDDGSLLFNAQRPDFNLGKAAYSMSSDVVYLNGKVSSAVDEKLSVMANKKLDIKGSEGATIEAMEILFSADKDVNVKSENGSIELKGRDGVYIDIDRLLKADTESGLRNTHIQFKLCYCHPSGKLFKVQARGRDSNCVLASHYGDPCQ